MTVTDTSRQDLLERYARWYGEERFAVAFTDTNQGDTAKEVNTKGWDKTLPLTSADYAAGLISNRCATKNVAIVLRPSNLVVLECDTEDDLLRIQSLDLPTTITVRSSKPYKRHFYFRPPPELVSLPYVAFRFETGKLTADVGRYFLAPPSIHPTGAIYAFLTGLGPGETDIAEIPESVYRTLERKAREETSEQKERLAVDPSAKLKAGQRGDGIFRFACAMRRWTHSRDLILTAARQYNEDMCDPPIDDSRVVVQVDGAMKKPGGQDLQKAVATPREDEPEPQLDPQPQRDSWTPVDLGTIEERPPIKPTLGHGGIAYPGKRHVFSGPPESAKTLAAYAIGLELVRDHKPIVIIDFEMGQWDARDRLRELGATQHDFTLISYIEPEEPATPARVEQLLDREPHLVIIDAAAGAYDLQGLDDMKRQDVERFTRLYVRSFWRNGIATIVLDHVVKNSENRGPFTIGSERKVGGADVHLGFEAIVPIQRGALGIYKITTHKDRGGYLARGRLANLHLASDPETHHISWEFKPAEHTEGTAVWMPTILMERASLYLEQQTEPVSFNSVITGTKGKDSKVKEALEHLISMRHVTETVGTHSARLVQSATPYRQETDEEQRPLPSSARPLPAEEEDDLCLPLPTSAPSPEGQSVAGAEADPQEEQRPLPLIPEAEIDEQDQALIDYYASLENHDEEPSA